MDTKLYTKWAMPDADGSKFEGSKSCSFFTGLATDAAQAQRDGPLRARAEACCCTFCLLGQYDSCQLKSEHGQMRTYHVPKIGAAQKPQLVALQEWADLLSKGMVVVFAADKADVHMEGVYWLAKLLDAAFPATAAMAHASDVFEQGWLVVKAQFYKYEPDAKHPKGWRGYSLLPEERWLVVNAMLRLKGIKYESEPRRALRPTPAPRAAAVPAAAPPVSEQRGGRGHARGGGRGAGAGRGGSGGGGRGRGSNSDAKKQVRQELSWLSADSHNLIMACVREDS
jgi:hypothetical protein